MPARLIRAAVHRPPRHCERQRRSNPVPPLAPMLPGAEGSGSPRRYAPRDDDEARAQRHRQTAPAASATRRDPAASRRWAGRRRPPSLGDPLPFAWKTSGLRVIIAFAGGTHRRGRPFFCLRVLRGGSWNNNQDNARSANRNRNNPNNRNNNIGFRVVCSATSFRFLHGTAPSRAVRACRVRVSGPAALPGLSADHGLRTEAGKERWRGRVPSARLGLARPSGA
jgi:hypothetical protein